MKVKINDIKIHDRIRKDLGNIEALSQSLDENGLFSPILITTDYRLIAGERRLEAAKRLGWKSIEVKIIENPTEIKALELEIAENIFRKPFTEEELDEGYTRIHRLKNPSLWQRFKNFLKKILNAFGHHKKDS